MVCLSREMAKQLGVPAKTSRCPCLFVACGGCLFLLLRILGETLLLDRGRTGTVEDLENGSRHRYLRSGLADGQPSAARDHKRPALSQYPDPPHRKIGLLSGDADLPGQEHVKRRQNLSEECDRMRYQMEKCCGMHHGFSWAIWTRSPMWSSSTQRHPELPFLAMPLLSTSSMSKVRLDPSFH